MRVFKWKIMISCGSQASLLATHWDIHTGIRMCVPKLDKYSNSATLLGRRSQFSVCDCIFGCRIQTVEINRKWHLLSLMWCHGTAISWLQLWLRGASSLSHDARSTKEINLTFVKIFVRRYCSQLACAYQGKNVMVPAVVIQSFLIRPSHYITVAPLPQVGSQTQGKVIPTATWR